MKAQLIRAFGTADQFQLCDVSKPTAGPSQVLVKIAATSVNTADVKARELGQVLDFVPPLPATLGMDFAGTVEALGAGVESFTVGDKVYGCAGGVIGHGGALAEYISADVRLIARMPRSVSFAEAAALPLVSITAWEALFDRMKVQSGEHVLVQGGAGGVGHIAVQLALARGAKVAATASGERAIALIRRLGAEPIDYKQESIESFVQRLTGGTGFDAVFDTVGGDNIVPSFQAVRIGGQVATTVSIVTADLTLAHVKALALHVIYMLIPMIHDVGRERHGVILAELASLVDAGKVKPLVDATFPLDRAADAHRRLEAGNMVGKVVVEVG
jgi:NADPH:quinone reductase